MDATTSQFIAAGTETGFNLIASASGLFIWFLMIAAALFIFMFIYGTIKDGIENARRTITYTPLGGTRRGRKLWRRWSK